MIEIQLVLLDPTEVTLHAEQMNFNTRNVQVLRDHAESIWFLFVLDLIIGVLTR